MTRYVVAMKPNGHVFEYPEVEITSPENYWRAEDMVLWFYKQEFKFAVIQERK